MYSTVALASCNLDTMRWKWVGSTNNYSVFIDSKTIKPLYGNKIELWVCKYNVGNCETHNVGEHYDYCLIVIDYNQNAAGLKYLCTRDSHNNIIEQNNYYKYWTYMPLLPESDGEQIANAAYLLVYGKKR